MQTAKRNSTHISVASLTDNLHPKYGKRDYIIAVRLEEWARFLPFSKYVIILNDGRRLFRYIAESQQRDCIILQGIIKNQMSIEINLADVVEIYQVLSITRDPLPF